MAEPRASGVARLAMTFAAIAATLGGWLAMASGEPAPATSSAHVGAELPSLPPIPSVEQPTVTAPAARWPTPIATTRASR
jgi:hypothetical protein